MMLTLGVVAVLGSACSCSRHSDVEVEVAESPEPTEESAPAELLRSSVLGQAIDNFILKDFHGNEFSLESFADDRLVVVVFLGVECPLARLYAPRLNAMAETYASQGVAFVGINSNLQDSIRDLANYARQFDLGFPLLKDPANVVADQFKAIRTPEVFVLDDHRRVRYWGRIDNQFGVGFQRTQATRNNLDEALTDLLAKREVRREVTLAPGCIIGRVSRVEPHGEVTYCNQISRILQRRCTECHRSGEVAPFALQSYDEVVGWAEMIREVVHQRRMPPWLANPKFGKFSNNPSLTSEELRLIDQWVENGAPEGDREQLPQAVAVDTGWRIGEPDEVFFMSEKPFNVPAEGVVDYQYFVVDPGHKEDRWIQAGEARPGNRTVVHHITAFIWPPGVSREDLALEIGYVPGVQPRVYPPGTAIKLDKDAKLLFEVHYTPIGTPRTDRSSVAFKYADPATIKHAIRGGWAGNEKFIIPPGADNYKVTARYRFTRDMRLLSFMPHMHLRGKAFRYDVLYPDGTRETLLDVPRYDFYWQLWYDLDTPRFMPRGTYLNCTARFDNSAENPINPDPSATVKFGLQTFDEMMFGYFDAVEADEQAP